MAIECSLQNSPQPFLVKFCSIAAINGAINILNFPLLIISNQAEIRVIVASAVDCYENLRV